MRAAEVLAKLVACDHPRADRSVFVVHEHRDSPEPDERQEHLYEHCHGCGAMKPPGLPWARAALVQLAANEGVDEPSLPKDEASTRTVRLAGGWEEFTVTKTLHPSRPLTVKHFGWSPNVSEWSDDEALCVARELRCAVLGEEIVVAADKHMAEVVGRSLFPGPVQTSTETEHPPTEPPPAMPTETTGPRVVLDGVSLRVHAAQVLEEAVDAFGDATPGVEILSAQRLVRMARAHGKSAEKLAEALAEHEATVQRLDDEYAREHARLMRPQ